MVNIPGYRIIDQIYDGPRTRVYRGQRSSDGKPVVVKLLKIEYPTFSELVQFRNQYAIAKNLDLPGIVQPIGLENYRKGLALVMEDIGGISLKDYAASKPLEIKEFLEIAISIAGIIEGLSRHRIIHKDIKPQNILINPVSQEVRLIDFSIASLLPREFQVLQNPNVLEGTLAYMSPEQTGRTNRGIDYRTDFYSLGVTFYELLAGQLPFTSTDSMELIHSHIARQPRPPMEFNPAIPAVLERIVLKLMAKNPEDRYQSARGLRADLEICKQQYSAANSIADFSLGGRDVSDRFQIPGKIYGREAEIAQMLAAFERVAQFLETAEGGSEPGATEAGEAPRTSKVELVLVVGEPGIGKSALVHEIHKPIVRSRGYFIAGKFDRIGRDRPYSALVQAFSSLVGQLLTESAAQVQEWKNKISVALAENAKLIIDVIPDLELLIGSQPPVPEVAPNAAAHRFNLLFGKFIRLFATAKHPLTIFLDDLQWADEASLKLILSLLTEADTRQLLFVGAYRNSKVPVDSPLMHALASARDAGITVNQINLRPLEEPALNRLIADTLSCPEERAVPLTQLVLEKTGGNPFFAHQFLKFLYEEGSIGYDRERGYWQCDIVRVKELYSSDDVVEFMAKRLQKLPENTQGALKMAACIGNEFDLATLAIAREKSQVETATDLWPALQEGLILPMTETYKFFTDGGEWGDKGDKGEGGDKGDKGDNPTPYTLHPTPFPNTLHPTPFPNTLHPTPYTLHPTLSSDAQFPTYRFLHDRMQQSAYFLIADDRKQAMHLKIGKLLLGNTPRELWEERIFDIVNQLNMGVGLLAEPAERDLLAQLNLIAGRKALTATAYTTALGNLAVGKGLLTEYSWETRYELTLSLYESVAEAAYPIGDFEEIERLAEVVLQRAKTLEDKLKIYELKIKACIGQNKLTEAVRVALEVAEQLGISFPEDESASEIRRQLEATKSLWQGRAIADLMLLPKMTAPDKRSALRILSIADTAVYRAFPKLLPLFVCQQVGLSLNYGNAPESAGAYANYGLILCTFGQDIDAGYQFGQLAVELAERFQDKEQQAKTLWAVNSFIVHWQEHLRETLFPLLSAYDSGSVTGDWYYAAIAAQSYGCHCYALGKELGELEREMSAKADAFAKRLRRRIAKGNQEAALNYHQIYLQAVFNLQGSAPEATRLIGLAYNEEKMLPLYRQKSDSPREKLRDRAEEDRTALGHLYFNKLLLSYLFGAYREATQNAAATAEYLDGLTGTIVVPLFYFYQSLANLAAYPQARESERESILAAVAANLKKLDGWAGIAPMNYLHKSDLIRAELHRALGENMEAMDYYARAIAGAKEEGYINEEALAHELAAQFYLDWGKETIAKTYLTNAYYAYARWGATAKVKDLERRYSRLLPPAVGRETNEEREASQKIANAIATSGKETSAALDLASVIKASQVLSGEIILDKLLSTLIGVAMENAGAQKCCLILYEDGSLAIAAQCASGLKCDLGSTPVQESEDIPLTPINYVQRTKETLVIDDATANLTFAADPYIIQYQPKSIICTPLLNQGKLVGILYLENNLATGAFTSDRLEVLRVLTSQAAISVENARLYQKSQGYAQQLEQSLQEKTQLISSLQDAQLQLVQSEKMSTLGNLVAGVAHEINNPVGFIAGNLSHIQGYIQDLLELVALYQEQFPESGAEIEEKTQDMDLEYLLQDLPKLMSSMQVGTDRIRQISTSLRTFSRSDTASKVAFNIHDGIDSTLLILKHRLKASECRPEIEIIKEYGDLPPVNCYPGQLNQVFMNLIANAIDALDDSNQGRSYDEIKAAPNQIRIRTEIVNEESGIGHGALDIGHGDEEGDRGTGRQGEMGRDGEGWGGIGENQRMFSPHLPPSPPISPPPSPAPYPMLVKIAISDNGPGMSDEVRQRLFDHLFTTKPPGKGTGLGLSIARQIIVEKHGGQLRCISSPGQGAQFVIEIPL